VEQLTVARRGMSLAHWVYSVGFVAVGLTGGTLLEWVGSTIPFENQLLWCMFGVGFMVERYGAMHLQLYTTTNHVVWHIANGVTGSLYLGLALVLLGPLGIYAFPLALTLSYAGFYAWYAAYRSYKLFGIGFWEFETRVLLPPATVVAAYCIAVATGPPELW
jgi:hypothetical protein